MAEHLVLSKDQILAELASQLAAGTLLRKDEPLARRTTLRVGGSADIYAEPASESDLARMIQFCARRGVQHMILGRGSNLVIRDGGVRGIVISLAGLSKIEASGCKLSCGAGAKLKNIAMEARRTSLRGFEFLDGIPGSLGGALRMNAGAMGSAIFDLVEKVRVMDCRGEVNERTDIVAQYRSCPLFQTHIAVGAVLRGNPDSQELIAERMKAYNEKRWEVQPKEPSAGCTFKNPKDIAAGKLIDELGLKGTRVGGALVSPLHGNFIINDGTATARDVLNLIEKIVQQVKMQSGIELQREVEVVGED